MVKAYSDDLRWRCVDAMASGEPASRVSKQFGVAKSSVIKWHDRYRKTGRVSPSQMGRKPGSCLAPHRDFIFDQLEHVSHNAVWLFLRKEGLSFKKNTVRN